MSIRKNPYLKGQLSKASLNRSHLEALRTDSDWRIWQVELCDLNASRLALMTRSLVPQVVLRGHALPLLWVSRIRI
jgi:hypothetical protein